MKWFQAFPHPIPEDRAYVVWRNSQVMRVATEPGKYGLGLEQMALQAPEGFAMLEWDLAIDLDDMAVMEAAVRWKPDLIHVAPYPLWWKPEGPLVAQWNQPYVPGERGAMHSRSILAQDHMAGLGLVYFPAWVLDALAGRWSEVNYPHAEADIWGIVGTDKIHVLYDLKPKHLHW